MPETLDVHRVLADQLALKCAYQRPTHQTGGPYADALNSFICKHSRHSQTCVGRDVLAGFEWRSVRIAILFPGDAGNLHCDLVHPLCSENWLERAQGQYYHLGSRLLGRRRMRRTESNRCLTTWSKRG